MPIARSIFVGAVAALAVLGAPAMANNSNPQKVDDKPASSSCDANELAADGSWTRIPCQELGASGPTTHKSAARKADKDTR
jgi:ABC-type phosphate transport system substrate-binding protein